MKSSFAIAALLLATAGLAMAYAPKGVRINALNPSKTATDRFMEGVEADARQRGEAKYDGVSIRTHSGDLDEEKR